MADFNTADQVVRGHEGGIGTLAGDPGGCTAYGWSQAECDRLGIPQPTSPEEAMDLDRQYFWNPLYDNVLSQNVGTKILDDAINQGTPVAILHLQNALVKAGSIVNVDGIFGPATLTATNLVPEQLLLPWFRLLQYQSYDTWIKEDPLREALRNGLANRAAWPDPDGSIAAALLAGTYNPGE